MLDILPLEERRRIYLQRLRHVLLASALILIFSAATAYLHWLREVARLREQRARQIAAQRQQGLSAVQALRRKRTSEQPPPLAQLKARKDKLETELQQLATTHATLDAQLGRYRDAGLTAERDGFAEILRQLAGLTGDRVWIERFELKRSGAHVQVQLQGAALARTDVREWALLLGRKGIRDVVVIGTRRKERKIPVDGRRIAAMVVIFELRCRY